MAPPPGKIRIEAPANVEGAAANQAMIAPLPASGFRLVRYFTLASLAAFVLLAAPLLYFQLQESAFFQQVQQEQNAFYARVQDGFAKQHDAAARGDLLRMQEAGNVNLTRLFANALHKKRGLPPVFVRFSVFLQP